MARSLHVQYESLEAFERACAETLAHGVVFVHVDEPPPLQARVVVELDLTFRSHKATFDGEVVNRLPAQAGSGAGVAVQLLASLAAIRKALGMPEPAAGGDSRGVAAAGAASALRGEILGDATTGPPLDPEIDFEPAARVLSPDDPEPPHDPSQLPEEGAYDPHERKLG